MCILTSQKESGSHPGMVQTGNKVKVKINTAVQLYTYWKRSAPYPSMITFDGASREVCTARRIRTNTPLQALTTLNDSAYIDMARNFAIPHANGSRQ